MHLLGFTRLHYEFSKLPFCFCLITKKAYCWDIMLSVLFSSVKWHYDYYLRGENWPIISPDYLTSVNRHQDNFCTQELHNAAEWTIPFLFFYSGRQGSSRRNKANWTIYLTFTVSSSLTGRPGNLRLASIHISPRRDVC